MAKLSRQNIQIKNVTHGLGNQEVKLVVTSDDGTWDGYIDYLTIK